MIDLLTAVMTWILVVAGWLIVSDQQEHRDIAKINQGRIEKLREALTKIEDLAMSHHTSGFDLERVNSLLRYIYDFSAEVSHLRRLGLVGLGTTDNVIKFRQAISGNNMDESSYQTIRAGSALLQDVSELRSLLNRELLGASHRVVTRPRSLKESISSTFRDRMW